MTKKKAQKKAVPVGRVSQKARTRKLSAPKANVRKSSTIKSRTAKPGSGKSKTRNSRTRSGLKSPPALAQYEDEAMPPQLVLACLQDMASRAYAPYSQFQVGALVETDQGYFTGCNVENASYGATVCAERVAIWKAISEGATRFRTITIYTPKKEMIPPCALCLQVMAEFCERNTQVVLTNVLGKHERYHFEDLLTFPFGPSYLKK